MVLFSLTDKASTMQICFTLYGHGSNVHFLIFFLNNFKVGSGFLLSGLGSIIGVCCKRASEPYFTVLLAELETL